MNKFFYRISITDDITKKKIKPCHENNSLHVQITQIRYLFQRPCILSLFFFSFPVPKSLKLASNSNRDNVPASKPHPN